MIINGVDAMEKAYFEKYDESAEISQRAEICSDCSSEKTKNKRKSPVIAALLSIIPGLGQVYAGDLLRGFAIIAAMAISFCLMALLIGFFTFIGAWIFGIADAYKMVKKQNEKIELS
jgi:TM2 domain-containing membrane protein YozV